MPTNAENQKKHRAKMRAIRNGKWVHRETVYSVEDRITGDNFDVIAATPDCAYYKLRRISYSHDREYVKILIVSEKNLQQRFIVIG